MSNSSFCFKQLISNLCLHIEFFQAGAGNDFSMFDAPRTITSPTAALAQEVVGNEPHKLQLMKSSLFVDDAASDDEIGM